MGGSGGFGRINLTKRSWRKRFFLNFYVDNYFVTNTRYSKNQLNSLSY